MKWLPLKRGLDLVGALTILLMTSPLLLGAMIAVRLKLGSPIFFRQKRPGLNGKVFEMFKLRTMLDSVDSNGNPLPDADRLSPFGIWLRKTSLDELPALLNVVAGQMSLVGPRPLLVEYLPLYNERQRRRLEVKPGITGWAQVNGRNAISWEKKFELDVWYVENQSTLLDLKILLMTIRKVLLRDGISADGHVTQPKFRGSN